MIFGLKVTMFPVHVARADSIAAMMTYAKMQQILSLY